MLLRQRGELHRGDRGTAADARSEIKIEPHDASPLEHILEGFRFVRNTPPIGVLLLLTGVISIAALPYSVLMPILRRAF